MTSQSTFAQPRDFLAELANIGSIPPERAECDRHGPFEKRVVSLLPNGRRIHSGCPGCSSELQAETERLQREQKARDELAQIAKALDRACIPPRFRAARFDTYAASSDRQRRAVGIVKRYSEEHLGGILVLCGKPGTGKTHLACAVAAQFIAAHRSALFTTVVSAVRHVKDTYRRDSERSESQAMRDLVKPDLLILDEVGVQLGTEHELRIMFEVINERYAECLPTILISNLTDKALADFLGERLTDRVRDGGAIVAFDWESHRGRRAA